MRQSLLPSIEAQDGHLMWSTLGSLLSMLPLFTLVVKVHASGEGTLAICKLGGLVTLFPPSLPFLPLPLGCCFPLRLPLQGDVEPTGRLPWAHE